MKTLTLKNLTVEQYATIEAFARAVRKGTLDGIQTLCGGKWHDKESCDFDVFFSYRLKPAAKYRPWKLEEFPCAAFFKNTESDQVYSVGAYDPCTLTAKLYSYGSVTTEDLLKNGWVYSFDCKPGSWLPCGVKVSN